MGGGGSAPALTARKLGMTPRIRLGCCFETGTSDCGLAWLLALGGPEVSPWVGVCVGGWLCELSEVDWVASGGPFGVGAESLCCAKAQAVNKMSMIPKTKRKKFLSPVWIRHSLNSNRWTVRSNYVEWEPDFARKVS